jgi:tRNA A-37 threonylcarbamoyl transferase component Bud32/tetratricopeptide (TPR) repeat protein
VVEAGALFAERFEIERAVASGGMGRVFRARDRQTRRDVALKLLLTEGRLRTAWPRFVREAEILAGLAHPHVVTYLAHGVDDTDGPWLALEWLEGESLATRLLRGPLDVAEAIELGTRVASALDAVHRARLVHRDVKPSNLFLEGGRVERVKLLDFGVAYLGLDLTRAGSIVGTPGYLSPEQAEGRRDLDARADVFAMGCVLFECLAGRPAFTGDDPLALLAKILFEDVPRLHSLRADVPEALSEVIDRALAKVPALRPADGAALAAALEAAFRPRGGAMARPGITHGAQRILSMLVAQPAGATRGRTSSDTQPSGSPPPFGEIVRVTLRRHGVHPAETSDGSLVAAIEHAGSPRDRIAHAVRCALAVADAAPDAVIAVATGRGAGGEPGSLGDAIERAAILSRRGRPGVVVDDPTAALLDARFALEVDPARTDAMPAFLVRAETDSAVPRPVLGRATPFVGRERELDVLDALYAECADDPRARAVLVTGPPGAGKSRLLREWLSDRRGVAATAQVWSSRGDPVREGSPYATFAALVRRALAVDEQEPLDDRRRKLAVRVRSRLASDAAARVIEFVGELAGIPNAAPGPELVAARRDARLMGDQVRRAVCDWLGAELERGPLVLALDDLHWGDTATTLLLDAALRAHAHRPLFVLGTARPDVHERFPALWQERAMQELRLGPISRRAAASLVLAVLGETGGERADAIVRRADGNPLYLEELIRATASSSSGELPETVLAMVAARLDALDPGMRRVARAASVFGNTFWAGGVAALFGDDPRHMVDAAIASLVERELVVPQPGGRLAGEEAHAFGHGLVRDAAYALLTADDRRLGHRLAAAWLDEHGERDPATLAKHLDLGGDGPAAATWYVRAAEQALAGSDFDTVHAHVARAVECGAEADIVGRARLAEAAALNWAASYADADRAALAALAALSPESPLRGRAFAERAFACGRTMQHDRLLELADELTPMIPHDYEALIAAGFLAGHVGLAHELERAMELTNTIERALHGPIATDPMARASLVAAQSFVAVCAGDQARAFRQMVEAAGHYLAAGDVRNTAMFRSNAGSVAAEAGRYEDAVKLGEQAVADAQALGIDSLVAFAQHNLGIALRPAGDGARALAMQRACAAALANTGDHRIEGAARIAVASILLERGDIEEAAAELERALVLVDMSPSLRALGLAERARLRSARGDTDGMLADAQAAYAILEATGSLDEGEALVRLMRAKALWASAREDEARAAIAQARDWVDAAADAMADPSWRESFLAIRENTHILELARAWLG